MIEDCVIIGGGIAGLSAANQLADAGFSALLIEGSQYPAQRICGEYISHEGLPILRRWEIPVSIKISEAHFIKEQQKLVFSLPQSSGSCSRYILDWHLLQRAMQKGTRVITGTQVIQLSIPNEFQENYHLKLSDGQEIEAKHLMIGTGRLSAMHDQSDPLQPAYIGFKAHFTNVSDISNLEMYFFQGGYLGISKVDKETVNIAGLIKKEIVGMVPIENFTPLLMEKKELSALKPYLSKAVPLFPWMKGLIPEFGIRQLPSWPRIFWIGDAAGSIPPISGEGLALALNSGCMAADFFLRSTAAEFNRNWNKSYSKRFFWAQQIHQLMLSERASRMTFKTCQYFPSLMLKLWKLTRH